MQFHKVQIFGDSVMRGVILDDATKRYRFAPAVNFERFEDAFHFSIDNRSKFGCTVEKGYRLLRKALGCGQPSDYALLEFGGNDCDFNWAEVAAEPDKPHLPHTPPDEFRKLLSTMVKDLKASGIQPIIMSLPPIDAERYFNWITRDGLSREKILAFLGDVQQIYRYQELYSNLATQTALQTGCLFVDVRSAFLQVSRCFKDLLCEDGIHPSQQGQTLIYQVFSDFAAQHFSRAARC